MEGERRENNGVISSSNGSSKDFPEMKVIRAKRHSLLHSILAIALFIGAIHLNFAVLFCSFLFLPLFKAFSVLVVLLSFLVIPLYEESKYGRKLARYICKHACGYFPTVVHMEDYKAFDSNRVYVFGYEPHSVLPVGALALTEHSGFLPLSKIKVLGSSAILFVPFMRHIWTWIALVPASRKKFTSYLSSGYSCIIIPGGVREACHMEHGSEVVFLKSRKGFVRIAMETGCPLVPVVSFGQSQVYKWWKPSGNLFLQLSRALKFTPILFGGVLWSPIPYQLPIHVVVGRPIEVKKNPQPAMDEVSEVHGQFVEALRDLFERHKARVGHPDLQLKIL